MYGLSREYRVDECILSDREEQRHRGALNAALNAAFTRDYDPRQGYELIEDIHGGTIIVAFDIADAVIREYRSRAFHSAKTDENARYHLAGPQARIESWCASRDPFTPVHLLIVREIEAKGPARAWTRAEIRDTARVSDGAIDSLIRWGILVRETEAGAL